MRYLFIILLLLTSNAFAVGAPDYLPDGSHPRIWLTSDELVRLNTKQAANDADWVALETWCDAHIADTGYDQKKPNWGDPNAYEMSGFKMHLMNYALGYQILKDDNPVKAATYAARAREILINGVVVPFSAGEEINGIVALRFHNFLPDNVSPNDRTINSAEAAVLGISSVAYKQGYTNRNLTAVPIVYDWIYDTLSQGDKDILAPMMMRWFDWIRGVHGTYNNGVLIDGVRYHEDKVGDCTGVNNCTTIGGAASQALDYGKLYANYGAGEAALMAFIPLAIYGYNADVPAYLTAYKTFLTTNVYTQLESDLEHSGGDSVEGWNYGGGFIYTLPALYGYHTATADPAITNMVWPTKLLPAMTYRLMADYKNIPAYGYWVGAANENRIANIQNFAGIEQRLRPTSDASKLGQYLLNNSTLAANTGLTRFIDSLLWKRTDISELNPSTQPIASIAKGNGFFTSKSSWTDANAVHLAVRLEGKRTVDHEGYDEGNILLARGTDRLLVYKDTDAAPSVGHNTIVFNNQSHHMSDLITTPAIDRSEIGNDYSYVSGDITKAWQRTSYPSRSLLFRRSVLHILPGFIVVSDITRSNPAVGNLKEWYTQYKATPSISPAGTISATVGASNVYVSTMYPTGGTYTTTIPSTGYYRVKYSTPVLQEYDQFLHVIEATGSGSAQTTTTLIDGTNTRGAVINGNTIAMFTKDQSCASMASLSYSVDTTAASTHYITDLTPNVTYNVTIDGGTAVPYMASSAGIVVFTNPSFSPHTYTIVQDGEAPVAIKGTCAAPFAAPSLTTGVCSTGTPGTVSGTGTPNWNWQCNGSNGGSSTAAGACTATLSSSRIFKFISGKFLSLK